ncbi:MAG: hypothetical protein AMJ62_08615 [Myxococcales bacterium SG8_38]|nr:MAG: hypothetical protein AMJ62_08615 [Myxococcales bacterium SG8_38]
MRRFILVALMAVTVTGCDRFPDLSIQVVANLQPDEDNCSVSADQQEVWLAGVYDLNVQRDYFITPRIESYLVDNALEFQGQQGNIQIDSFDITLLLPDGTKPELGADLPNPYRVTTSVVIPVNEAAGAASLGAAAAIGIPASYYDVLVDIVNTTSFRSIVLEIVANGETSGGFRQQSPPFRWPIEFCVGCLGAICEEPAELFDPLGCFPGQDGWQYCGEIVPPAAP